MRSIGILEAVRALTPEVVAVLAVVVTLLGDPVTAIVALVVVYWFGDRVRGARLLGVVAGGLALALILKSVLALPRPAVGPPVEPRSVPDLLRGLYRAEAYDDGFGFPSGHAITATVTWGALAARLRWRTRRLRFLLAGGVVVAVSLTRVVLGLHYFVDVAAGVVIGVVYLLAAFAVLERTSEDRGTGGALVGGSVLGVASVVASGGSTGGVAGTAAILGATGAWFLVDVPREPWPRSLAGVGRALLGAVAFLGVGALAVLAGGSDLALLAAILLGMGIVVALPGILLRAGIDAHSGDAGRTPGD